MARISAEEKERRRNLYDDTILKTFLDEGVAGLTYENICHKLKIRGSTLQGYYPKTSDIFDSLRGKVMPIIIEGLDFSNEQAFKDSWVDSAKHKKGFLSAIQLMLTAITSAGDKPAFAMGIKKLETAIDHHIPGKGRELLAFALGAAVLILVDVDGQQL